MRTFSVSSIYTIDDIHVGFYSSNNNVINIKFEIRYPDGIRNSKKALKNLLKSSQELREILAEEVNQFLLLSEITTYSRRTNAYCYVFGNSCTVNIYLGQDSINQPIQSFIEEILRKTTSN